jgi:glutamate--cysteine ligase
MTATAALDHFVRSVGERLFATGDAGSRRIGAEIEMLPLLAGSDLPCPLEEMPDGTLSTLGFLRPYGAALGWRERRSAKGAPYFALPNGATLTFEPGGQLELCTPPSESISALLRESRALLDGLRSGAEDAGIRLISVGIDPSNAIDQVPLQLDSARYVEMTRYFESIGPSGVRMMRQTAATQVSVDGGAEPGERWRLLCDVAPYLNAIFANSPRYAGVDTGFQSFRAHCWRELDVSRTGVPHPELPPIEAYTRFALDAVDMMRRDPSGCYRPFSDWAQEGNWTDAQWTNHLTTLFPEVRPRGHLEVRALDAVESPAVTAACVVIAGLTYDDTAARTARDLVVSADEGVLNRAARCGLHDPAIAETARALAEIGLRGAAALGDDVLAGPELEEAASFFNEWTLRRRSPADAR